MLNKIETTVVLENGTTYTITSNGHTLNVTNDIINDTYIFKDDGEFTTSNYETALAAFKELIPENKDPNYVPEPTPPEFMTKSQIKAIIKDVDIEKYFGLPDRSFYKYWVKDSKITSKWHFNKVVYLIRQHLIPLKFKSTFWNTRFFTDNDAYMQKFFIDLKSEIDELIKNQS